jgi:small subunit ribosomal protein S17
MAEETPETTQDATPETAPETPAAQEAPAPAGPAAPQLTADERKVAARARRGRRRAATPEERAQERRAKAAARTRRREQERAKRREAGKREGTPPAERPAGNPQIRLGTVTSSKGDKTITVRIDNARRHRRYRKIVRSTTVLHAHDERNDANEGDLVRVVETRPMSRTKRWRLVEILERAK